MHLLRPSAAALVTVAPQLGHAFKEGAINLKAATALNTRLAESSQALAEFAQNPIAAVGLEDLTQTLQLGTPLFAGIAPAAGRLQLPHARLPQRREPGVRERRRRNACALGLPAGARRPEQPRLPLLDHRQRAIART